MIGSITLYLVQSLLLQVEQRHLAMLAHAVRQRPEKAPLRLRKPARYRLPQQDRGKHRPRGKILEKKTGKNKYQLAQTSR